MEAGRALDALVAQKVMCGKVLGGMDDDGEYWQESGAGELIEAIPVPYYSTDIAAAWLERQKEAT